MKLGTQTPIAYFLFLPSACTSSANAKYKLLHVECIQLNPSQVRFTRSFDPRADEGLLGAQNRYKSMLAYKHCRMTLDNFNHLGHTEDILV